MRDLPAVFVLFSLAPDFKIDAGPLYALYILAGTISLGEPNCYDFLLVGVIFLFG